MASRYLSRTPPPAADPGPDPRLAAGLTVLAPLATVALGYFLLHAIAIDSSTTFSVSYSGVRAAITQALERDVSVERIQEALIQIPDPAPGSDEKTKAERVTDRAARIKTVATRLNGDRSRLADALAALALTPHPGLDPAVQAITSATTPRERMAAVVSARLSDAALTKAVRGWVVESLDRYTTSLATNAVGSADAAANASADSIGFEAWRRAVTTVVSLKFDPFDTRPGESAWAADVSARLTWGIVALIFSLSFGLVAITSGVQISRIGTAERTMFVVVTATAAVAAAVAAHFLFSPAGPPTPLHRALREYSTLFGVAIPWWTAAFNALRAIGVVLLVAGSVATFWVHVSDKDQLREQLRGFKSLFNSGAVFLMAGVFEMYAAFRWPVIFAADDATRAALQPAAATLAAATGALFSVVLLAAYLVTTVVLRQQAVSHGVVATDVDSALKDFGFADFSGQQSLRLAQALLPLLPGVVTVLM